jgi:hypothetical protein
MYSAILSEKLDWDVLLFFFFFFEGNKNIAY